MLLCTVRTCHQPLVREGRRFVCARGHSFDVARSGYVNLLQPNERRSRTPGDTAEAVAARRRLQDQGVLEPMLLAVRAMASGDDVLDVGCGDGYWLGAPASRRLAGRRPAALPGAETAPSQPARTPARPVGVDISVPAIEAAAKRYPEYFWVVANADRFLPFSDASFDLVLSITARMNDAEFRRVLRDDGRLLVAVPAPEDLIELRLNARDRIERTVATFAHFTLLEHRRVTTKAWLDETAIREVMACAYRRPRREALSAREVTFSLDLLLFAANTPDTPEDSSP